MRQQSYCLLRNILHFYNNSSPVRSSKRDYRIYEKKDAEKTTSSFKNKQGDKPGYVRLLAQTRMIIFLEWLLPAISSDLPKAGGPRQRFCSVLLRMGFTYAPPVTRKAVVSYTALPPLPDFWRYISVALSLESPLPDVIRHSALWSPDFPHLRSFDTCSRDHLSYLF